jgi:predicted NBD/HSP70 family sugar kinase
MAHSNDRAGLAKPLTLAIDIGGSHLKAAVLKESGESRLAQPRGTRL